MSEHSIMQDALLNQTPFMVCCTDKPSIPLFTTVSVFAEGEKPVSSCPFATSFTPSPPPPSTPLGQAVIGAIALFTVALPIIIIIVIVVIVIHYMKAKRFNRNQTAYSHPRLTNMPPSQVFYDSNHHLTYARASPTDHTHTQAVVDWTKTTDDIPQGELMHSAPPSYHVALKLPNPTSKSEDPPPYPG